MARPTIKGVIFDVGHVLARVSYDTIARNLGRHSSMTPAEIRDHLVGTDLEIDSETGKYDSREYFRRVKDRIQGEANWRYDEFVSEFNTGLEMTADGKAALRYAATHARAFLMSNTGYLHSLWIYQQEEMATLPEQHFFSFREGMMKPDPRLWEIFFARTGLAPECCLFIDDRPENRAGAEQFGIRTLDFKTGGTSLLEILRGQLPETA